MTGGSISQDDVWGMHDENTLECIDRGMIVAQGYIGDKHYEEGYEHWKNLTKVPTVCPVWGDRLPYKSVTVICKENEQYEVEYWLEYVHGSNSVEKIKVFGEGRVAIRSNYMCW